MMKYLLHQSKNGCRLGVVMELGENAAQSLETPVWMLYTKSGSAPNLTRDVLNMVGNLPGIVQMPVSHLAEHQSAISQFKKGIGPFCAMEDFSVYCSLQDPAEAVPIGYNDKNATAVWGKGGKIRLDIDVHTSIMESYRPALYQALCDSDTNEQSSNKRIGKSVDRTLAFLDACLKKQEDSKVLSNAGLIGVVEGGYNIRERKRSAKATAEKPVAGFCVEGFHSSGHASESFLTPKVKEVLAATLQELPEDKPRMLPGVLTPDDLMEALQMGFDIFDTSYPYIVGTRGSALVFKYYLGHTETSKGSQGDKAAPASSQAADKPFEISLKDKRYAEDFSPLVEGCNCHACQHHTKAYINHLLNTSEILADVLLTIHNFHHYLGFTEAVRKSLQDDTFLALKELILSQR